MKVRSKIAVDINLSMSETVNTIIHGEITSVRISNDFQSIVVKYTYKTDNDVLIKNDTLLIVGEDIDTLKTTVESILPNDYDTMSERDQLMHKYLSGFRIKLAETFNLNVSDTEIY